ncbi:MAG TPA: hypothetical protein PKE39_10615 [Ignavibacteria bacterium]|nr:hypothetical protein [Ignavibacteria bacterium]HMQ99466.1 hypothetical protein [Ignavibacteria bacterium]
MNSQNRLLILVLIIILTAAGCSKTGHYEKGKELLAKKQYPEAIAEFQKIDAIEKDYRLAQSKIAYIQGLQSFNDSLFSAAEVQLVRVASDDEYYHESQLMLDKINQRKMSSIIPKTDTLIVREEIIGSKGEDKSQDKVKAETESDLDKTAKFTAQLRDLIEKFESLYQSAYTSGVSSKENYLTNMRSVASRLNALDYGAKEKDANALELKQRATAWMNKRIEFIGRLIKDNTAKETNTSRSLKEEGDKLYYSVTQQIKKTK